MKIYHKRNFTIENKIFVFILYRPSKLLTDMIHNGFRTLNFFLYGSIYKQYVYINEPKPLAYSKALPWRFNL